MKFGQFLLNRKLISNYTSHFDVLMIWYSILLDDFILREEVKKCAVLGMPGRRVSIEAANSCAGPSAVAFLGYPAVALLMMLDFRFMMVFSSLVLFRGRGCPPYAILT
jgi:hypothetical protein